MGTMDTKLYVAVGVLAVLGGGIFFAKKNQKAEAERYTLSGQEAQLPKITITDDDIKGIDKHRAHEGRRRRRRGHATSSSRRRARIGASRGRSTPRRTSRT